ncbi:MAG: hypothetical protein R3A10_02205 [Caldilineaceae bacterium]
MSGIQIVEGNILFPNIVGPADPLVAAAEHVFAFFAGLSVGGIVGGIIGVPVAAALRVLVVESSRWPCAADRFLKMPSARPRPLAYADD